MRAAWLILACGVLAGCVTEVQQGPGSRGVRVNPNGPASAAPAGSSAAAGSPSGPGAGAPEALPSGPVAKPAVGVTTSAAVRVTFYPIGTVIYDGLTLPLISPDGRMAAVQSGEAPEWPTLLAEDQAAPTNRTTITVFDISGKETRPIQNAEMPAGGLMLGRGTDSQGFLVESPQRDGSRWIGRVGWLTGRVEWLVQGPECNAHAVLTVGGGLLYTRRRPGETSTDLVLKLPGKEATVKAGEGEPYAFPMAADDPGLVYACRIGKAATDLEVLRVKDGRLEGTLMRRTLGGTTDPLLAYQVSQTCPPVVGLLRGLEVGPLVLFSPRFARMAVFDLSTGVFEPLAPKSVAAGRSPDPNSPGYFCTTPTDLEFVPKIGSGGPTGAAVNVISTPYVARTVESDVPTMVLIGPVRGAPDRLELVRMVMRSGEER